MPRRGTPFGGIGGAILFWAAAPVALANELSLTGLVVDNAGLPVKHASVIVETQGGRELARLRPEALFGRFSAQVGIDERTVHVHVIAEGYEEASHLVRLVDDRFDVGTVRLSPVVRSTAPPLVLEESAASGAHVVELVLRNDANRPVTLNGLRLELLVRSPPCAGPSADVVASVATTVRLSSGAGLTGQVQWQDLPAAVAFSGSGTLNECSVTTLTADLLNLVILEAAQDRRFRVHLPSVLNVATPGSGAYRLTLGGAASKRGTVSLSLLVGGSGLIPVGEAQLAARLSR